MIENVIANNINSETKYNEKKNKMTIYERICGGVGF